ncbi:sensor histidine kinase [Clostridium paridis]|uniref:histidine kinase n=1 Tax=Clostridium paridis TaxID=2803863 RepID=A0A937FH47_9CLOT|nr:HAMP domain-containing sensor histidine kinase [Clostridium paridis]MBL4933654.1 HAMP domain-containing histidine kinase [Clostridium paridis]
MKFSIKIFISTVLAVAISFSIGGYLLIYSSFISSKDREISRASDERLSVQYMLESAIVSKEMQGKSMTNLEVFSSVQDIAKSIEQSKQGGRKIIVYDKDGAEIYPTLGKKDNSISGLTSLKAGDNLYNIHKEDGIYNLYVTGIISNSSGSIYLSYVRDISDVFMEMNTQLHMFMIYQCVIIFLSAAVVFIISWLLTRNVRKLTEVSRRISAGEYDKRADIKSSDEIGELAKSFNSMAISVEDKISKLEQSSTAKDEFIANFTHEFKTPMTSIIGYSDMLRSKELDSKTTFKAANYIYSEANRLEALSLKMLDLVMLQGKDFKFIPINTKELIRYVVEVAMPSFKQSEITLKSSAEEGTVVVEPDLMKTLLNNVVDNARKASEIGSTVELLGHKDDENYTFTIIDHGKGIPEEELSKITEAFYMVDKSRSRAQHGVGLGLAIAERITKLHNTTLKIDSIVGVGTTVNIKLPCYKAKGGDNNE